MKLMDLNGENEKLIIRELEILTYTRCIEEPKYYFILKKLKMTWDERLPIEWVLSISDFSKGII